MIADQSTGKNRPSISAYPAGVCIQLFTANIQNDDSKVPKATIRDAKKYKGFGTSLRPNNKTPRNAASRKNAVRPSYANSGARTLAVASAYRLQLVPNWNGMMMPDTTPMPKDTENILIQNVDTRA